MNKILLTVVASLSLLLAACGDSPIDGVYESKGGKVGIYEMTTMKVQKMSTGSNYTVTFAGPEKTLTYENVELKNKELQINDKGFMMPIKFDGDKATVVAGGSVFEKSKIPASTQTPKVAEVQPTNTAELAKVEYPTELFGKWVSGKGEKFCRDALKAEKQTGMWDGVIISKDGLSGMEFSCNAASVSNIGDSFKIAENCGGQGDEWKLNTTYTLSNGVLKIISEDEKGQKNQSILNTACK
jgi:starvation-inducible outer membrane lipoprotein